MRIQNWVTGSQSPRMHSDNCLCWYKVDLNFKNLIGHLHFKFSEYRIKLRQTDRQTVI